MTTDAIGSDGAPADVRPADRLDDPPADLLDRVRLLEEVETDLRSQLGALDGR